MSAPWRKLLVLDVERTCWAGDPPVGEVPDIIQVGCCIWNSETGVVTPATTYHCRPERSLISPFCTALTGITPGRGMRGEPFADVCTRLTEKYGSRNKAWAAFGDDASDFREQCAAQGVPYPFSESYFNLSALYVLMRGGGDERLGLSAVLERSGLAFTGTPHRAGDDAYNAARLARELLYCN